MVTTQTLQEYAAYCPSCGQRLYFHNPLRADNLEAVQARCWNGDCMRRWSMVFDMDASGTFGVTSFQCDNEDRVMDAATDGATGERAQRR